MKNFLIAILLALCTPVGAHAAAGLPLPAVQRSVLNLGGAEGIRKVQLGTQLVDGVVRVKRCLYDFAVHGGAVSTISLDDTDGKDCVLPTGAVITQVYFDILTAFTSTSNDGTIALTANSSGDLLAAVDADTLPLTASHPGSGIPIGTAATMVKLTAQRTITMAIAVHAITAGKANFYIQYVVAN